MKKFNGEKISFDKFTAFFKLANFRRSVHQSKLCHMHYIKTIVSSHMKLYMSK